jgi:hypothetical protein
LLEHFLMHLLAYAGLADQLLTVQAVEEVSQYWGDNLNGNVGHGDAPHDPVGGEE